MLLDWKVSLILVLFSLCIHAIAQSQTKWKVMLLYLFFFFKSTFSHNGCVVKWHILPLGFIRAVTGCSNISLFINSLPFYSFFFFQVLSWCVTSSVSLLSCHHPSGGVITQQMTMDDWPLRRMSRAFSAAFALRVCRSVKDAACASKEKTRSWIIHLILRGEGEGSGEKNPFCVGDDIPRGWCHASRRMRMMSPPNLIYVCEIVGLIVQPQSIFLTPSFLLRIKRMLF